MKTQFSSAVQLFKWNTAVINLKKKSSFLSFSRSVTWRHGFYIYPVALFGIVISDVLRKLNSIQFSLIVQQQPLLWNLIALRNAKKHKLLPEFKKKKKAPVCPMHQGRTCKTNKTISYTQLSTFTCWRSEANHCCAKSYFPRARKASSHTARNCRAEFTRRI